MRSVSQAANNTLGEVADRLLQGVRTSKNEVFVLQIADASRGSYVSEILGREVELEDGLLKPFLSVDAMRRYYLAPAKAAVIFPYTAPKSIGGVHLLDARTLEKTYPRTWAYLRACEDVLRGREDGAMDHDGWYGYGRTQNLDLFGIPRILVPDMMEHAAFALDEVGNSAFVSGYGIIPKPKHQAILAYLTGLLNSALLNLYLKNVSTPLRGGWFRAFPQFLRQIPIKLPETAEDKKLADRIVESVRAIMQAKVKLRDDKLSDRERQSLQGDVESLERRIDEAVFRLYGVKGLPAG